MNSPAKDRISQFRNPIGVALAISPFLLVPAYLHLADWLHLNPNLFDIIALLVIIFVGLAGVFLLSKPGLNRIGISVAYTGLTAMLACMITIGIRGSF